MTERQYLKLDFLSLNFPVSWAENLFIPIYLLFAIFSLMLFQYLGNTFGYARPKKVVLFLDIDWVKLILSLTRPRSQMYITIFLISEKKQAKKQENKKAKETKEEKRISPENRL